MKKILYFLAFILAFIGFDVVEAKEVTNICYYRDSNNIFTFAVKAYDNGKSDAILMNSYDESSFPSNYNGHKESQDFRARWSNLGSVMNGSSCYKYMKYSVNSGSNDISFSSSQPTNLGKNDIILQNYDFESTASKCVYKGLDYKDAFHQTEISILISGNSIFTYFDGDLNTALDESITKDLGFDNNKIEYTLGNKFYGSFIEKFNDDSKGCPLIDTIQSYSGHVWIGAIDDDESSNFGLVSSNYDDEVEAEEELKSYPITFDDGDNQVQFYIKTYNTNKEKICLDIGNGALKCTEMNYQNSETFIHSGIIGQKWYNFKIKKDEISNIFQYEVAGDFSTLKNPNPVYFNRGSYDSYYLSKSNEGTAITSSDNGQGYKQAICSLKPYLDSYSISYQLKFYDDAKTNPDYYKINDVPCDQWGYGYALSCSEDDCPYLIEQAVKGVRGYCNNIYSNYTSNNEYTNKRIEECIDFNEFYLSLVQSGVINDLSIDCPILTGDLIDKLIDFLDIIKIAGPLLALGLGTLDFVRTVASGDADKEMKNTFKRFSIRLIAAALLFLVPFILAFLMDLFLGNQSGYNIDNPFCGVVDWGKQ